MRPYLKNCHVAFKCGLIISSSSYGDAIIPWCCANFVVVNGGDENRAARWGCPIRGFAKNHNMDTHLFLGLK